ncbi:ribulose-phosphate 3-epimerase [[Eubacterium] cellulosolvens]
MAVRIVPSIISSDLSNLDTEIKKIESAKADRIHIDVYPVLLWILEYHALSKYTIGSFLVDSIQRRTPLPIDLHFMIEVDRQIIMKYLYAKCELITIPIEASYRPEVILQTIRKSGAKTGISINPFTPLDRIYPFLNKIDSILFLTTNANYGGKIYYEQTIERISEFRKISKEKGFSGEIGIDGGVNLKTVPKMLEAGVNTFYIGQSFFKEDSEKLVNGIRRLTRTSNDRPITRTLPVDYV